MTTTEKADPRFEVLPIDWIRPHPRNVRHDVGDVSSLAASIAAEGILEPLVVTPVQGPHGTADPDYLLIAGHRRLAAAKTAGLAEVPCMIHPSLVAEADQLLAMLNENGHRADLTAVEEAKAYQDLLDLDIDADQIATRTGRRKRYVQDRIKLTKASDALIEKVAAGAASLTEALTVQSYERRHPTLAADLEAAAGTGDWKWALARAERSKVTATRQALAVKDLRAAGVVVLIEGDGTSTAERDAYRLTKSRGRGQDLLWSYLGNSSITQISEAMQSQAIESDGMMVATFANRYTDVLRWHQLIADNAAAEAADAAAEAEARAQAEAATAQVREDLAIAATLRRRHVAQTLHGGAADVARAVLTDQLMNTLENALTTDVQLVGEYLDVTLTDPAADDYDPADDERLLLDHARTLSNDQLAILVHLLDRATVERTLEDPEAWRTGTRHRYFNTNAWRGELVEWFGYEWTDAEAALVDQLNTAPPQA